MRGDSLEVERDSCAPEEEIGPANPPSRWITIVSHCLLALIGVSALLVCLSISFRIGELQYGSMEWTRVWTDRMNRLVALRCAVSDVADAFRQDSTPQALKQFASACSDLDTKLATVRLAMLSDHLVADPFMRSRINARINDFARAATALRQQTTQNAGIAPPSVTEVDRQERLANDAITAATTFIRSEQLLRSQADVMAARRWIFWQYAVAGIAVPFMFILATLSVGISLRLRQALKARDLALAEQKLLEQELRLAAQTDKLTGLPNRAVISDHIQRAIARHRRDTNSCFAVLYVDLDRFKHVNDTLGHEAGDELLCEIANRLRSVLREEDIAAIARPDNHSSSRDETNSEAVRLGGDEFVILLEGLRTPEDACVVAERILEKFNIPFSIHGRRVHISASIGLVTSDQSNVSATDMLRDADTAMYDAKLAGKGRYAVFDPIMREPDEPAQEIQEEIRACA